MTTIIRSLALVALAIPLTFGVAVAQDAMKKGDAMSAGSSMSTPDGKAMDSMGKAAMKPDAMKPDAMKMDSMSKDQMGKVGKTADAMKKPDAMAPDAMGTKKN